MHTHLLGAQDLNLFVSQEKDNTNNEHHHISAFPENTWYTYCSCPEMASTEVQKLFNTNKQLHIQLQH